MDLQRDSLIRMIYLRAGTRYILCALTHCIAIDDARRNNFLARLMEALERISLI
jgi:hypothetical protein